MITNPEANRSGVGVKQRWHFDVVKTDWNRQAKSVRSANSAPNQNLYTFGIST
jgi:hypothetical protein